MYAFVHIERTAGTSVNSILRRSFGTGHCDIRLPLAKRHGDRPQHQLDRRGLVDAEVLRRVRRLYRHLKGIAGHNVKPYGDLIASHPEIRFFTFLRDPAARLRSHFLNAVLADHGPRDFDRWVTATWVHNWQTKMIAGEADAQKAIELLSTRVDFVGLTERFDESVLMLGQWLQEPGFRPEYRRINQLSDKRPPHEVTRLQLATRYLDSDPARSRIQEAISEDQKVYDFVTATVFPRQLAAYRGKLESDLRRFRRRNRCAGRLAEPIWSSVVRNFIYKPLLHCRVL
jgi:Sulfotransferase family